MFQSYIQTHILVALMLKSQPDVFMRMSMNEPEYV